MIASLGLFTLFEPSVEFLLFGKSGAIDTLHLLALGVALPISTGQGKQLESLQFARMRHVRPEAKIDERRIVYVINARGVRNLFVDQLAFERLIAALENVKDLCLIDDFTAIDQILLGHRLHPLFDGGQIVFGQISRSDNVVVKAVTRIFHQGRADAKLCSGEQVKQRRSQQVSGRVANKFKPIGRISGDRLDEKHLVGRGQFTIQIDFLTVNFCGKCFLQTVAVKCLYCICDRRGRRYRPFVSAVFYV